MKPRQRRKQSIWKDMADKAFINTVSIIELQKNYTSSITVDSMINRRLIKGETTLMELEKLNRTEGKVTAMSSGSSVEIFSDEKPFKFISGMGHPRPKDNPVIYDSTKKGRNGNSGTMVGKKRRRSRQKKAKTQMKSAPAIVFKNPFSGSSFK